MEMFEGKSKLNWKYEEEEDVLYISSQEPQRAIGIDIGEGLIVRWDDDIREIIGVTIVGLKSRLDESLKNFRSTQIR